MLGLRGASLAAGFRLIAIAASQSQGWDPNGQVNTTMCYWDSVRAAVIRDTLYLDGGILWWRPGMSTGEYGNPIEDHNPLGYVWTLNFSTPFNISQNISALLQTISKSGGGTSSNFAPRYQDGALLANDAEWLEYGGLVTVSDSYRPPDDQTVLRYEAYQYGPEKPLWRAGFTQVNLDEGMTRYLAYGGAASAPSENKGWYFSGMHSPTWDHLEYSVPEAENRPLNISNTLLTLDMSDELHTKWDNVTLPNFIDGRASPEVVWVPVGKEGILVVLGGVTYPEFASNVTGLSSNSAQAKTDGDRFMRDIDVYDIANKQWYQQPTTDGPGVLTRGCAVVASAQDNSSFNLYYYGGYDGVHYDGDFNDDVWVLSLPSFTWTKVYSGEASHGRASHRCVKPYPDQMFVVGGYASTSGTGAPPCLEGNIIQVYNLTSNSWMGSYDPSTTSDYGVPGKINAKIGGDSSGGATLTTPSPSGWATTALAHVFATAYDTSKIKTWYPYEPDASSGARPDASPDDGGGGGGLPKWVPPVLGVVLGLALITCIAVAVIVFRRRKMLKKNGTSVTSDENGHRIRSWIRGQPSQPMEKASTVTSEPTARDATVSPDLDSDKQALTEPSAPTPPPATYVAYEMPDTSMAEMMDTSPPAELAGLGPAELINSSPHFGPGGNPGQNPVFYSGVSQADHVNSAARNASRPSNPGATAVLPPAPRSPPDARRIDSPSLGTAAGAGAGAFEPRMPRGQSEVSVISDRDRMHLRQISDTTVSSIGGGGDAQARQRAVSPAQELPAPHNTPASTTATALSRAADEAVGSRLQPGGGSTGSPSRRSVFYESQEDLGHAK